MSGPTTVRQGGRQAAALGQELSGPDDGEVRVTVLNQEELGGMRWLVWGSGLCWRRASLGVWLIYFV